MAAACGRRRFMVIPLAASVRRCRWVSGRRLCQRHFRAPFLPDVVGIGAQFGRRGSGGALASPADGDPRRARVHRRPGPRGGPRMVGSGRRPGVGARRGTVPRAGRRRKAPGAGRRDPVRPPAGLVVRGQRAAGRCRPSRRPTRSVLPRTWPAADRRRVRDDVAALRGDSGERVAALVRPPLPDERGRPVHADRPRCWCRAAHGTRAGVWH